MEIRKILYVLLVGGFLCMIFAGVLKYMEGVGKKETSVNESTAEPVVQVNNVLKEVPTKEPVTQITQEWEEFTVKPPESLEETMEPTEEPTEVPTEQQVEAVGKPDGQASPSPVKTAVPTMAPITEPPQKQEEIPIAQNTQPPISPIKEPQETEAPKPQNTPAPMPTEEPPVEEVVHVHDFEKSVWELPTCEKGGYYNNVCKSCGFVECVSQEPLPHETEDIVIQEGNCMEDRVIRHVCKLCGEQTESDTRYPIYDKHQWGSEEVDGMLLEYCERCGIVK